MGKDLRGHNPGTAERHSVQEHTSHDSTAVALACNWINLGKVVHFVRQTSADHQKAAHGEQAGQQQFPPPEAFDGVRGDKS